MFSVLDWERFHAVQVSTGEPCSILSSDLFQLLLCLSRVLHVELQPVKSLICAQEDMIPIPRMVYLSPTMEL